MLNLLSTIIAVRLSIQCHTVFSAEVWIAEKNLQFSVIFVETKKLIVSIDRLSLDLSNYVIETRAKSSTGYNCCSDLLRIKVDFWSRSCPWDPAHTITKTFETSPSKRSWGEELKWIAKDSFIMRHNVWNYKYFWVLPLLYKFTRIVKRSSSWWCRFCVLYDLRIQCKVATGKLSTTNILY